jgi:hypothetical protein
MPGIRGPKCYCSVPVAQILSDINAVAVPAEALVEDHCWRTICQVRGRNFKRVDAAAWARVCAERGYLKRRFDRF